jgi:hypothetical protein
MPGRRRREGDPVAIWCSRDGCTREEPCRHCKDLLEEAVAAAYLRRTFGYCTEEMLQAVLDGLREDTPDAYRETGAG